MLKRLHAMRISRNSEIFQMMEAGFAEDLLREVRAMANGPSYARWALEPYSIGMKLRTLRTQRHLTLSRLAVETNLSTALLSKLETDRMIPTLPTLANICRVYGVGLSYFFSDAAKHTLAITRKAHLIGNGRGQDGVKQVLLHALTSDARLVARMVEYPQGASGTMSEGGQPACSLVYVLEGKLQMDSGGMHEVLETGDCAYVDSDMAIAWGAQGTDRCRVLSVTPGNRHEG
ncbi:XRE family transcriptional regulator [Telmatobacter sp. DSM 110680]|uniref:XRE family transcriptional regulator n=1 Tax=Telmatobacter sp. DSM 110680 TaxID=3036704 RepID=A0AAU7DP47_9BACT